MVLTARAAGASGAALNDGNLRCAGFIGRVLPLDLYLAAAHNWAEHELPALARIGAGDHDGASGPPQPAPSSAEVRAWARANGLSVPDRGRLRPEIHQAWQDAHNP